MKFLSRFKRKNQLDLPDQPGVAPVPADENPVPIANGTNDVKPPAADEVCLRLGDFLHRIPAHLLQVGPHDLQKEVRFPIDSLSGRIKRGETTINLAEIYRQLPEIFRTEVREADKQQILYPWRKVISMIKDARPDETGSPDGVAENLAEKIRQKKPVIRGAGPMASPAPQQTPILRGRGKSQASWFSRTTLEKGIENPPIGPTQPAQEGSADNSGESKTAQNFQAAPAHPSISASASSSRPESSAAPVEFPQPDTRLKASLPIEPAPAAPAKPSVASAAAPESQQTSRSAETGAGLADLPPELQRRVAVIKGDYERQLAELELARTTYAAEVDRLQSELNRTADRLDEERTANAVSREMLQQNIRDRDATQQQIADLQSKLASLQKDGRLSAITAERDALLQQKAHLSSQISELSKRGASALPRGGDNAAASAVLQRQVEEFQRRIALMESAQRDTALELAREKEARAKADKLLAAAEKLQEQSANYMETAKAEIRKEIEASVKPREIEARKIQKELQDQLAQLTDQNKKLAAELENARAAAANATANPAPFAESIHSQAISQLEEDIENYRERLKALLKERDAARAEAKEASAKGGAGDINELLASRARLEKEFETLRKDYAAQSAMMEALRQERASGEAKFAAERSSLESRLDSLRQALEAAQSAHASQVAVLQKTAEERSNIDAGSGSAATTEFRRQLDEALAAVKAANDELAQLRLRHDEHTCSHANLAAELERERAKSAAEREATAARLREESHSLEQQLGRAVQERDEWARKHAELNAAVQNERTTRDELIANLERDHTSVVRAKEDLSQRLAEAERAAKTGGDAAAELTELRSRLQVTENLQTERDQLATRLSGLENEAANARTELSRANEEIKRVSSERDQTASARAALLQEIEAARQNQQELTTALEEERRKAATLQGTASVLDEERQIFAAQRAELENQVAASAKTATQLVEQSAAELAEYHASLDSTKQALAAAQERANTLDQQLSAARADHERLCARVSEFETNAQQNGGQVEQLKQRLESAQEEAEAAILKANRRHEEESSRARREIENLQTERDNLAQQRDELLRRLSRISEEQKRLLDDLASTPQVMPPPTIVEDHPPANVIEVNIPEVLPPEPGNGIAIPRVRAMSIPPPKVHTL